jgi:hypothetical protein
MVLLAFLSLLGMALFVHVLTRRSISLCVFAVVAGVPGTLYLAALAGALGPVAIALFYGGLAAGIAAVAVAAARGRGRQLAAQALSPAIVLLTASTVAFWAFYRGLPFHLWDEFSHWGLAAREMAMFHHLPYSGSLILFQDYPPGAALFYYFCTVAAPYSEGLVYFGHFILLVSPLALLFRGMKWRDAHWIVLTYAAVLLFLCVGGSQLSSIYVDSLLSVYFAMTLYAYFSSQPSPGNVSFLVPALFLLPLIKKPGGFFAVACLVIILADAGVRWAIAPRLILSRSKRLAADALRAIRADRLVVPLSANLIVFALILAAKLYTLTVVYLALVLVGACVYRSATLLPALRRVAWPRAAAACTVWAILLAAPFAAHQSWQYWVRSHKLVTSFETKHTFADTVRTVVAPKDKTTVDLRAAFMKRLWQSRQSVYAGTVFSRLADFVRPLKTVHPPRLSSSGWTILAALMFIGAILLTRAHGMRVRLIVATCLAMAAFVVYLGGLFSLYLYAFSKDEGPLLVQLERYVWVYLLALALLGWGLLAHTRAGLSGLPRSGLRTAPFALCLAFASWVYAFENEPLNILPPVEWITPFEGRPPAQPHVDAVCRLTAPSDSVFVILQVRERWMLNSMRYDIMPRHTEFMRCLKDADGTITFDDTPEHLRTVLKDRGFTHVYVGPVDEDFYDEFGDLFDLSREPDDCVFRVAKNADDELVLEPVRQEPRAGSEGKGW